MSNTSTISTAPLRALPLFGIFELPQLLVAVLPEYHALGANGVVIVISEHDRRVAEHNIGPVVRYCINHGYRVYLSLSSLYESSRRVDVIEAFEWLARIAEKSRCEGLYLDQTNSNGRPIFTLGQLSQLCRRHALKFYVATSLSGPRDVELLRRLGELRYADILSVTHEYDFSSTSPFPEEHVQAAIARIRDCVGAHQHLAVYIPPSVLRANSPFLPGIVQSWRSVGVSDLFVWGGFCANQEFAGPSGSPNDHGIYYSEIGKAFGCRYDYTKFAAEFNSLTS